jgi:hypothetical protein
MKWFIFTAALALLIASHSATVARAEQTTDAEQRSPLGVTLHDRDIPRHRDQRPRYFSDIHNVLISVIPYPPAFEHSAETLLPKPLRREHLERLLSEIYAKRFSSNRTVLKGEQGWPAYGLTDPDIVIVNRTNLGQYRSLVSKEETLTAMLQISVQPDEQDFGNPHLSDVVALNFIQFRPKTDATPWEMLTYPLALRANLPDAEMEKRIQDYLLANIKQ